MATTTSGPARPVPLAEPDDPPYRLTFDDFALLVEEGRIPEDRRVYLCDGRLYEEMARTQSQVNIGMALNMALAPRLPAGWSLCPEGTIQLDDFNGRVPDFAVIKTGRPMAFYAQGRYPTAADVGIAIEIAHTGLEKDLGETLQRYARARIPVYWVLDLRGCRLLVHWGPVEEPGAPPRYEHLRAFRSTDAVPVTLEGVEVAQVPAAEFVPARPPIRDPLEREGDA